MAARTRIFDIIAAQMQIAEIAIALEVIFIGSKGPRINIGSKINPCTYTDACKYSMPTDGPTVLYIFVHICVHIGLFISAAGIFINIRVRAFHENKMDGGAGRSPEAPQEDNSMRGVEQFPATDYKIALHLF